MKEERRAIGFRTHSGWALAVVVGGSPAEPEILERRRIETADPAIRGSKQPFHAAEPLPFPAAEALVLRCRESSTLLAQRAVGELLHRHSVTAAGILCGSGRPLPALAAILKSHALIHTAEGELFREILIEAVAHAGVPLTRVKEKDSWEHGAAVLHMPDLRERIDHLRKRAGPPWRQDEKLAALAAWLALHSMPPS
jgi:hypothetical protein